MKASYPARLIGRKVEWSRLQEFLDGKAEHATLGIVWGRRRVGKSLLLESFAEKTGGFYYEAVRGSGAEALRDLGERLGSHQGSAAPLALADWEAAVRALLALARSRRTVVVLDEYPYLLEHTPGLDSIIQRVMGPRSGDKLSSRARLVLCGSAMSMMSGVLSGTAPLRGRAGLDLRMSPFDFRQARALHGIDDLRTALHTYAVIGGVAAYAREMVDGDMPSGPRDFDRWVCRRVLSPAAPLFSEVPLLLSEDPAIAKARKLNLYHAALAGVAGGHHSHAKLTSYVKTSGPSLAPIIEALVASELVERVQDPLREKRPTYHPADPLIRFYYVVIRRHHARLGRHDAATGRLWSSIMPTFRPQVVGPCFEALARAWVTHFARSTTIGGEIGGVGPTTLSGHGGIGQVDVIVTGHGDLEGEPPVLAIGEAKAGERISERHLRRLEAARRAIGARAAGAKLLLFGTEFSRAVMGTAGARPDVEVIDLDRLYGGD